MVVAAALISACSTSGRSHLQGQSGALASLEGRVVAAGKPLAGASVTIYGGAVRAATELGHTAASSTGQFRISYTRPDNGVIYVLAGPTTSTRANPATSPLLLAAVVGVVGAAGGVAPHVVTSVTVNELTTVATSVALAQFVDGTDISGPSPGLENAAATTFNLADPSTGGAGGVITDENNGTNNDSLATLYTLADLVAVCSQAPEGGGCAQMLRHATPPGAGTPTNTVQAIQDLVKNPTTSLAALFALAKTADTFSPSLAAPPRGLDDRSPLHRHRPVLVRAYRHRRQRRRVVQQQLGAGYEQPEHRNQRAQPRWRAHPGQPDQRRRGERRGLGDRHRPGRVGLVRQRRQRRLLHLRVFICGEAPVTQHRLYQRCSRFSPRRRRRPEGQHLDRQQLRARERSGPGRRRGLPRGQPGEGHHYHRGRAQPPLRHPNRRAGRCLGLQRRPGRGPAGGHQARPPHRQVLRERDRHRGPTSSQRRTRPSRAARSASRWVSLSTLTATLG